MNEGKNISETQQIDDGGIITGQMTLRDYEATAAMQAMLSVPPSRSLEASVEKSGLSFPAYVARAAYAMADAMLQARKAKP